LYIPEYHRIEDPALTQDFLKANPFAILVSSSDGVPFATHLPIITTFEGGQLTLVGHVAKANPHWKVMQDSRETLAIFHGPHAYISPSLYEIRESVPTWNYTAVHIYGTPEIFMDAARLRDVLQQMIHTFEPAYLAQWDGLSETYKERTLQHIVGFQMLATRIETKFKLSQNRTKTEQANVIANLQASDDSIISGTGELMQQLGLGVKK
jgi:transcriptional regulator